MIGFKMKSIEFLNVKKYYYLFNSDMKKIPWLFTHKGHSSIKKAVNSISFTVAKGEIVGIIGINGTGKSTILKLIAGITTPTEGTINVNGTVASLINLTAGLVPDFTGIQNIQYKCHLLGMSQVEIDARMDDIISFADIGEYIDLPIKTYSSGMKAKLAFSINTHSDADVLLIDEIFAVGDRNFKMKSRKKAKELLRQSKTVVMVSHNENIILEFCTRCLYIREGKLFFDGNPQEALRLYAENNS